MAGQVGYEGWRTQKRRVLKFLLLYQLAVLLLGATTLSWNFASVVVPLYLFSIAVLAFCTWRYARDGDWEIIHVVFGANLRDVINIMRSPDFARQYGLGMEDVNRLGRLAAQPDSIAFAQELFANHQIVSEEPSDRGKRVADVVLLLLGAIVGGFAGPRLKPPDGSNPEIWRLNPVLFVEKEPYLITMLAILCGGALVLHAIARRRAAAEHHRLVRYAREQPLVLLGSVLPYDAEVRDKVRDAVRAAARLSAADVRSVTAMEAITGLTITRAERRPTVLSEMQWMVLLFDLGIVLGVVLPPLLGIR
jgi:hypothetical protein